MERWKDIPEFEGRYQVSDYGRIRSLTRTVCYGKNAGVCRTFTEIIMTQRQSEGSHGTSYPVIWLRKPGVHKKFYVHKLVAIAFVPNPDPETHTIANHIDGDKNHCRASNLEWCTPSQNSRHYHNGVRRVEEQEAAF